MGEKLRIINILLYKNFLVRKRRWKMGLFLEILVPLLLFLIGWAVKNAVRGPPHIIESNEIYNVDTKMSSYLQRLYVAPNNKFTDMLMDKVNQCLSWDKPLNISRFNTEKDMVLAIQTRETYYSSNFIAVVFENETNDFSKKHLKYKIRTPRSIPKELYSDIIFNYNSYISYDIASLQMCLDESFIKMKARSRYTFDIQTQQMPTPPHVERNPADEISRLIFCIFALLAFLIPLCVETSFASDEKFLGINVLMSMNGVSNYLNLLSWLLSGLIFSIFYTVPTVILLNFTYNDDTVPYLYYGNSFIFWVILTLNLAHLIAFGIHISAYFARSLFLITGILVLYIATSLIQKFALPENAYSYIPYLGIFFPNILLFRACEEVNHYEGIMEGIRWNKLFRVGNSQFKLQGSIGMIAIFSILGTIFHLILANYIYTINPGKYGAKKSPFYFLKFLKKLKQPDVEQSNICYNRVENIGSNNINEHLFELVAKGVYIPGIRIKNLKKTYSTSLFNNAKVHALKNISIDFYQKQITVLLGHNGAGKTTMMSILTGMINPTDGSIVINGKNIKDELSTMMNCMGLCPQENMYFPSLSVAEQLTFFGMLKNKNKAKLTIKNDVMFLLNKLKLSEKQNALPKELSGGQKRRVCLGMALIADPSILILDEPTSGLDPESKRDIWDILLKMRENKTILISTHDLEEADILGDRIAIVHSGSLRSYGTPLFLKKCLGRGNIEVTLSTEEWCDSRKILNHLDAQCELLSANVGKIELSIPQTPELPDLLDKIESNKKILGITGMSVSLITLEQVFLQVTRDNENELREPFIDTTDKLKGGDLLKESAKALLHKKMIYTKKNIPTFLTMLSLFIVSLICISLMLMDHSSSNKDPKSISVRPDMYYDIKTYYKTNFDIFGTFYKLTTEEFQGEALESSSKYGSIINELLSIGSNDIADYEYHYLAAADYHHNNTNDHFFINATALYHHKRLTYSRFISVNLLTNSLLKTLAGVEHSISISLQELPPLQEKHNYEGEAQFYVSLYVVPFLVILLVYSAVALFVIHPIRERLTNIKHLQRMLISCFNYWGTMFVFDFFTFLSLSLVYIIGLLIMDVSLGLQIFTMVEVLLLILLFSLFAMNILPLIYCFSFWNKTTIGAIKLLSLLPIGLLAIELTVHALVLIYNNRDYTMNKIRPIQRPIFLSIPYVSFCHGMIEFFKTALTNGYCKRMSIKQSHTISMCSDLECHNGVCEKPERYFNNFRGDVSLETSIITLCLTTFIYFGLLFILELKLFHKLIARIRSNKSNLVDEDFEEQVRQVKHNVAFEISKIEIKHDSKNHVKNVENGIEEILPENNEMKKRAFLVYELRKLYGRLIAVDDVTFDVNHKECFGLLGVNGAGKSTTFRMMTGEEIPDYGTMFLGGNDLRKNQDFYLSQMGYCPQNDAIIRSLNAYDHLSLFARLRGIPEDQVNTEVRKWIDRLNLNACALQPSGTYSGGNKRRLNIAIALIGIPNLVLMDEPTTGVDPAARRSLWNVIQLCQASGQAVILTSHSMEECEVLCNRLAIMVDGKLQCIGAPQELKQRFGAGYNIQIKLNPGKSATEIPLIKENLKEIFSGEIMDKNSGYLMYHVTPSTHITWRQMYNDMNQMKNKYQCIEEFSVLSSTLEQLFLMFARAANKSNEAKK